MTEEERPGVVKWARSFWDRTKDAVYIGGVVAGIIVGVLKWYQETFPPVVPVTSGEMAEQFDELHGNLAAFAYRDSLYRDSLRIERAQYDSLGRIVILALSDVQVRVGRLESGQVETRLAVEESKRQAGQTSEQLIRSIARQSSAEARAKEQQERRDKEERERDRALMLAIAKKLKIETKEF